MIATNEQFADLAREALREAMAEKEDAERLVAVEALLTEANAKVSNLAETVVSKEAERAAVAEERESLLVQVEALRAEIEKFKADLDMVSRAKEEFEGRAVQAEGELAQLATVRLLAARMAELETEKVAKAGEKREVQETRVCAMSDEEFASYKDELVEMRSSLEAELKAAMETAAQEVANSDSEVLPADLEAAQLEGAALAAASLNIEVASTDLKSRFTKMGEAMAKVLLDSREQK